ncbi:hypothetical protein, partial [Stenotrophomonas maltophilia group sp. RNC7]|uniref:hypothetical protein n=1 Tax=Stenotrophomonas maltophilia group sp. RNC7 TaxID=3071467 RepID=UPI0027E1250A
TTAEKTKLNGIQAGAQVNTVTSVAGRTGAITLAKGDVQLGNIQNYPIATQAQAEAGTADNVYMTSLKVAQAIAKLGVRIATGTYVGNDTSNRVINIGFTPKVILVSANIGYNAFAIAT